MTTTVEKTRVINYDKHKRCTCTLYVTEACNLNCIYCYEHIKGDKILSLEIAQQAIKDTFNRAIEEKVNCVEILFHGGEPFMAYKQIRTICEWVWGQEWPLEYICYATTNGTLIHGEIKQWLSENSHRFAVGLSLDGTPDMHNRNRSNSFDKIDLKFFMDTWPDQGVKMTPSPGTLHSLADGVIHIHKLGFKRNNCSFANGVSWDKDEHGNPVNYMQLLKEQLLKLATFYLENPDIVPIDLLNIKFLSIAAGINSMENKLCGAGTIMRCWTPDGQCLPCHLFYEVSKKERRKLEEFDFSNTANLSDPRCKDCVNEPVCPTCYGGNYISFGDIAKRDPYICNITKMRVLASSWMVGQMLENPSKYQMLNSMSDEELAMTAKGVIMAQNYFESSGFLKEL